MRPKLSDYSFEQQVVLAGEKEFYTQLEPADLNRLVGSVIAEYSKGGDPDLIFTLDPLYTYWTKTAAVEERSFIYDAVRLGVIVERSLVGALDYFLCQDPDFGIVARATLDVAMLHPIQERNPLTGATAIVEAMLLGVVENRAAAFAGLLNLGDRRVNDLLLDVVAYLTDAEVEAVAHFHPKRLWASTVEFWLGLLEPTVDSPENKEVFAIIGSGLIKSVSDLEPAVVLEASHNYSPRVLDHAVRIRKTWSLADYFDRVRPRMEALSGKELEPKIMPSVIEAWSQAAERTPRSGRRWYWPF